MEEREIVIETTDEDTRKEAADQERVFNLPVSKVRTLVQADLKRIAEAAGEDDVESRSSLYDILGHFAEQTGQPGTSDDFHNLAVDLAQRDEYALACDVLSCGIKLFPRSVDLLADFLQYGARCGRAEECRKQYEALIRIPRRRWTWRGFVFHVEYLKYLMEQSDSEEEIEALEEEMLTVAADFRQYHPYREEAYRIEASVYECLNYTQDEELGVLREALERLDVAPKCALRYADILFQRGKYADASRAIERAVGDATQTMAGVNEGYIYYLSALCRIALSQKEKRALEEGEVKEIYSDFNIALTELKGSETYVKVIRTKTNTLVSKTGIEVSPEYDSLWECIAG